MITQIGTAVVAGMAVMAGIALVVAGVMRRPAPLGASLARLSAVTEAAPPTGGRWARLVQRRPGLVSPSTRARLEVRGLTPEEFLVDKVIHAVLGLLMPGIIGAAFLWFGLASWQVPAGLSILGGIVGWFIPDLQSRRTHAVDQRDAAESLLTMFDLVALGRLANMSATQALGAAAALSDTPVFLRVRRCLDTARLQQRSPYQDLRRLAAEWKLPLLDDLVDVLQMEQTGAALSEALASRVTELRSEHLVRDKIAAHAASERLTFFMVVPAMVFGLIFLVPAVMRLLLG